MNITPEKIDAFVKLRNQKTHTGTVNLDDSVFLYLPLVMLVYICVLEDIGVPEEEIFSIIYPSFIYH